MDFLIVFKAQAPGLRPVISKACFKYITMFKTIIHFSYTIFFTLNLASLVITKNKLVHETEEQNFKEFYSIS